MEILLVSFVMIFVSMIILVGIQVMRKGELPTGCSPDGCGRCRKKKCPAKSMRDAQSSGGGA